MVVEKAGPKRSICISLVPYTIFVAANFNPQFYTLVPASALLGLFAGFLWIASGIYITRLAVGYSRLVGEEESTIIARFNGIFYMMFTSSQIWGNLVSSLVLHRDYQDNNNTTDHTSSMAEMVTYATNYSTLLPTGEPQNHTQSCGAVYCSLGHNVTSHEVAPPQTLVYILLTALGCCSILGLLITLIGLDRNADAEQEGRTQIKLQIELQIFTYSIYILRVHFHL